MIELLDLGVTISMLFLFAVYSTTLLVVGYTSITNCLFNCKQWRIIPAPIGAILLDLWDNILCKKKSDVWLGIIVLFLSIIPISLLWPLTYPIMGYMIVRYKNSQRFANLSSSV